MSACGQRGTAGAAWIIVVVVVVERRPLFQLWAHRELARRNRGLLVYIKTLIEQQLKAIYIDYDILYITFYMKTTFNYQYIL